MKTNTSNSRMVNVLTATFVLMLLSTTKGQDIAINQVMATDTSTIRPANSYNIPAGAKIITNTTAGSEEQPAPFVITSWSISNISCTSPNGSVSVTVNHGSGSYNYSWSPGGATESSISGLTAGVYTCYVTDGNGSVSSQTAEVADNTEGCASARTVPVTSGLNDNQNPDTVYPKTVINNSKEVSQSAEVEHSTNIEGMNPLSAMDNTINLYPNPATSMVNLSFLSPTEGVITIYNETGQRILQQKTNPTSNINQIDCSNFRAGVYLLIIETEHSRIVKKLIKV